MGGIYADWRGMADWARGVDSDESTSGLSGNRSSGWQLAGGWCGASTIERPGRRTLPAGR